MKRFVFLLTVPIFLFPLASASEEAVLSEKTEPERFHFTGHFQKEFQSLFEMISREYPDLLKSLEEKDSEHAMTALLNAIHSGIEPVSGKMLKPDEKKTGKPPFHPMIQFPGDLIFLRMENIDPTNMKELERAVAKNPGGIILDLRNCSSGEFNGIRQMLQSLLKRNLPHLAILTGPETEGASEIIAELLMKNRKGIRIGEETAGKPFPRKTVAVGKRKWLVPQPPEGTEGIRYGKLLPQIREKAEPIQSIKSLTEKKKPDPADHTLSRAADLLTTMNLLDRKGLKR